jgi:hypothetical protein
MKPMKRGCDFSKGMTGESCRSSIRLNMEGTKMKRPISERAYFAAVYLKAAKTLAEKAHKLEIPKTVGEKPSFGPETRTEHLSTVVAAVLMSVAFLEALINEIFSDAADRIQTELSPEDSDLLKELWALNVPRTARYSVVDKFRICLAILRREKLNLETKYQQDIRHLIDLRNTLMHYEPECQEKSSAEEQGPMLTKLRGLFPEHPAPQSKVFFPGQCLSAGCAHWSVTVATDFADEFCKKLGIAPPYDR